MEMFDVYPLFDVEPVKGQGCYLWDKDGNKYLDLYGGHAVISIGHSHPLFVQQLAEQAGNIGFYSNSVQNSLQSKLARKLGKMSGYEGHQLFLCNSGAEANENALKLASFHNGRDRVIAFRGAFHGRTSAAVSVTDNPKIQAPINKAGNVQFLPLNDAKSLEQAFNEEPVCAVIIEGLQGVGGIFEAENTFLQTIRRLCDKTGALLIVDEIQSGYGRTGEFFVHQYANVRPDLITVAKGMGNGFPIGGVLIHPDIKPWYGLLGSTFGGNHLACTAGLAVLEVMEKQDLVQNARSEGAYLREALQQFNDPVKEIRGKGLMIGIELEGSIKEIREALLYEHSIFTGASPAKNTLRLLPPLTIGRVESDRFLEAFAKAISTN